MASASGERLAQLYYPSERVKFQSAYTVTLSVPVALRRRSFLHCSLFETCWLADLNNAACFRLLPYCLFHPNIAANADINYLCAIRILFFSVQNLDCAKVFVSALFNQMESKKGT